MISRIQVEGGTTSLQRRYIDTFTQLGDQWGSGGIAINIQLLPTLAYTNVFIS